MQLKRGVLLLGFIFFFSIIYLSSTEAFVFNGTVRNITGSPVENAVINITVRDTNFNILGYNFTNTSATGVFTMNISNDTSWFYQPSVTKFDGDVIKLIGQSVPAFSFFEFSTITDIPFYLREAGTINISAINSSGQSISFNYQVKDVLLGYPIAESWDTLVSQAIVYVPADRNYSIVVYPDSSLPVSFNWNNFTSAQSYDVDTISDSNYNTTTNTITKEFNTTLGLIRVFGFINYTGVNGWEDFNVVSYLLEPGEMLYYEQAALPFNMSAFSPLQNQSDNYSLSTGFYNITLPAPAESANFILFAAAKNSTNYGGFGNITITYGDSDIEYNFSHLAGLLGTISNITLNDAQNWNTIINVTTFAQTFNILNSTNGTPSQLSAHYEVTVDYSSYGAIEFTYQGDISQTGSNTFAIPLLNVTGIKELNIYTQQYAPKSLSSISVASIQADNNISLTSFNPGDIDGQIALSGIDIALYISNATCDVPDPAGTCVVGSSKSLDDHDPFAQIIGGGRLSFRMGTGSIQVHYVNVDMLASGPPDALFDDSSVNATSGDSFSAALRFGSKGPKIFDYVLVSFPYTETEGDGLDDSKEVNLSINLFYDDNWNVIWNTTDPSNGTNASVFAANYSHYSTKQSLWQILIDNNTCVTDVSTFNETNPCYLNTTANLVWIRLPHFSGTGPSVSGSSAPGDPGGSATTGGSSGGGGAVLTDVIATYSPSDDETSEGYTKQLKVKERVQFKTNGELHFVKVLSLTTNTATIEVSSHPQQATLSLGETRRFDVNEDGVNDVKVTLNTIVDNKADLTITTIAEEVQEVVEEEEETLEEITGEVIRERIEKEVKSIWPWVITAIVLGIIVFFVIRFYEKKN